MKIYAVPKTQTNTYTPNYQRNNSISTRSMGKTNFSGDKLVSPILTFGKAQEQFVNLLQDLLVRAKAGKISGAECEKTIAALKDEFPAEVAAFIQEFRPAKKTSWVKATPLEENRIKDNNSEPPGWLTGI